MFVPTPSKVQGTRTDSHLSPATQAGQVLYAGGPGTEGSHQSPPALMAACDDVCHYCEGPETD